MSSITFERKPREKQKTTGSQWIVIGLIIVVFIVVWIILWFVLVNNLFGGSDSGGGIPPPTPGCMLPVAPTGLVASQPNLSTPSIFLEWTAVLIPGSPGETILGYRVYSRESPGISKANTSSVMANTFSITLTSTSNGPMTSGTEVFLAVSTIDTCGESGLSGEISFTPV